MNTRKVTAIGAVLFVNLSTARLAFADASYQSTTQITGGTLVDTMKSMSFLGKSMSNLFAPTTTMTMVHGNQKAVVSKDYTEIIDLDNETVMRIDAVKKTYTVMTFAQMRQAMEDMPRQMQQAQGKMEQAQAQQPKTDLKTSFDVSVKNTGVTKVVNGLNAQEQLITMTMKITDPSAPATDSINSISYVVTTDAWIAPDPPEVKEIQDFDIRMGKKMMEGVDMKAFVQEMQANGNAGIGMVLGNKPGASDAMAQMGKEMAKLKGTRVLEVTSMGGSGTGPAVAGSTPPNATAPVAGAPANQGGSVAGQVATDTATQTASGESSRLGVFGSALSSSALGAFRRKKAAPAAPAPTPATSPAAAPAAGTQTSAVLMSMTMQETNFSQEPVPLSAFQVLAGFKKVPSPYDHIGK
jgi:hypothetical protein